MGLELRTRATLEGCWKWPTVIGRNNLCCLGQAIVQYLQLKLQCQQVF